MIKTIFTGILATLFAVQALAPAQVEAKKAGSHKVSKDQKKKNNKKKKGKKKR
jgi:hypothetical protein